MTAAVTVLLSLSGRVYSPVDSSLCISLVLISQDTCAHCLSSKPHLSLLEFSICEYLNVPPVPLSPPVPYLSSTSYPGLKVIPQSRTSYLEHSREDYP
jgi:hypothetical protein